MYKPKVTAVADYHVTTGANKGKLTKHQALQVDGKWYYLKPVGYKQQLENIRPIPLPRPNNTHRQCNRCLISGNLGVNCLCGPVA